MQLIRSMSPASRLVAACLVIALIAIVASLSRSRPLQADGVVTPPSGAAAAGTRAAGMATPATASVSAASSGTAPGPMAGGTASPGSPVAGRVAPGASWTGASVPIATLLARLAVAPEQRAGYERSLFVHWIDADSNGCDTRREVLIAEAIEPPIVGAGCSLSGGRWRSAYDGIETGDPAALDIDHLVPLAEAWDSGARTWSADRRKAFANDLGVPWALIAVSGASNRSKADADPREWLPSLASFRCTYVAMWLSAKVRWSLAIDDLERAALAALVSECPGGLGEVALAS